MRLHSRFLFIAYLTMIGCDCGAKVKEPFGSRQNPSPLVNVGNVEAVRMVFHAIDYDERQEKAIQYLIRVGEKAFPTYEAIQTSRGANPIEVTGVFGVLCQVNADRRRFLKHALSRLTDPSLEVRRGAVVLLRQIGSPAEASPVVALLSDEEQGIAHHAAKTLTAIGGPNEIVAMDVWLQGVSHREHERLRKRVQQCRDMLEKRLAEKKDPTK